MAAALELPAAQRNALIRETWNLASEAHISLPQEKWAKCCGGESSEQEVPQPERSEVAFWKKKRFPYLNPPNCAYEVSVFSAQRMGSMGTEFRDERNIGMCLSLAWY